MSEKNDNNPESNSKPPIQRRLRNALDKFLNFPYTAFLYLCLFTTRPYLLVRLAQLGKSYIKLAWMEVKLWYYTKLVAKMEEDDTKLKKLSSMDEPLPEDIADVLEISAILEIREYDLFGLAYYWWFGRPSPEKVLESHFARYMFNQIVPLWVRQYSRMVLELREKGSLDREALGVDRLPDATPESVRAGVRYAVILVTTLCILVLIAEFAFKYLKLPCFFPPCY